MFRKAFVAASIALMLVAMGAAMTGCPQDVTAQYQVTVQNLTPLQTYQPLIAVTHDNDVSLFREGEDASDDFVDLVTAGTLTGLVATLETVDAITDIYSSNTGLGLPATTGATITFTMDGFVDDVFSIAAPAPLSLVSDAFAGLDSVPLPAVGSRTYYMDSYVVQSDNAVDISSGVQNLIRVTITRQ